MYTHGTGMEPSVLEPVRILSNIDNRMPIPYLPENRLTILSEWEVQDPMIMCTSGIVEEED